MTPNRKSPRPADHGPGLPPDLAGPVELELAKAVEQLPGRNGLAGGSRYELTYDGYRCAVVRRSGTVRLWSRNGTDLTDKFPDVHRALDAQLGRDCVLDGELVVWNGERLDFGALQQRMITSAATIRRQLAPKRPASYVAFTSWRSTGWISE